jgi:hypothetical protein
MSPRLTEAAVPVHPERPDLLHRRFTPLRLVAAKLRASTVPADAFFDPDDFMVVSWAVADRPAGVHVFKHVDTRRVINLDADGVPYRRDERGGWSRYATLREAVDALDLWELPWLRPELAGHRGGCAWEERRARFEELTGADRAS